jgi:1-acyl-sn-glycerol-3-phosphate acyltransferase
MVLEAGVPVIPCAMVNTDRLQPPGHLVPKVVRPEVRFGKPLDFSRYAGMESDRLVLRAITDEIMYELMRLSGQQYVDIYATKAKEQLRHPGKRDDEPEEPETPAALSA